MNISAATSEVSIQDQVNISLESKLDSTWWVRAYQQSELDIMSETQLTEVADCYRDIFNESWDENWTTETALDEIRDIFQGHHEGRTPIAVLLYKDGRVSGFSWGLVTTVEYLIANRDMPYDLALKKKKKDLMSHNIG